MVARTAERRPIGALARMSVVAALHVGIVFLIARSLGLVPTLEQPTTLETHVIKEERRREDPPPLPVVDPAPRRTVYIPTPVLPPDAAESENTITGPPPDDIRPPPTEIIPGPMVTGVRMDSRYPLSQPPYPPQEIRVGNTGTADIEVYVLPNGRVGEARIVRSTGYEALDVSALTEAKRNWRLLPATRDGVPVAQWHRLRVTFKLNQR